ncbi:LacI family transcriptional regulator [Lacticaseibacillus paracasei]|nr:LacI family transcriptional regulator [Lacticaseibacillus paracasei]
MVIIVANKKNASIKDVARLSGVSVATVSRIMNDSGRYSQATRDKVLRVIEEIGYERNSLATSLRLNKSNMIGILVPDIANEFYASVLKKLSKHSLNWAIQRLFVIRNEVSKGKLPIIEC